MKRGMTTKQIRIGKACLLGELGMLLLVGLYFYWQLGTNSLQMSPGQETDIRAQVQSSGQLGRSSGFGEDLNPSEANLDPVERLVVVDIKGEVKKPGVYSLKRGSRVKDLIEAAGGVTDEADLTSINLAQSLKDEMVLLVPKKVDEAMQSTPSSSATLKNQSKINLNTASKADLLTLNGVGESKAEAILAYREKEGRFYQLSDLKKIKGFSDKIIEKFKDQVMVQ